MHALTGQLVLMVLAFTSMVEAADRPLRPIPPGRDLRERFLKLIDRPRVALDAREKRAVATDAAAIVEFSFASEVGQRVPGVMVIPDELTGPAPVVIALHGTGGSKQGMVPLLRQFARRGIIGVAIDGRFAGERVTGAAGADAYRAAILETWKTGQGFPFFYDTVWDVLRLLDYFESRKDVNAQKIGAIGFSKGGIELYLAAAVDERFAAAVPCIGVQSFGWAIDNNSWQSRIGTIQSAVDGAAKDVGNMQVDAAFVRRFYERVVPGIHQEFDGPAILPLIAPRPLLVINGDRDDRTPRGGLELCVTAAHRAYKQADASQNFEFISQPNTQHAVKPESERKAIDWLVSHLSLADKGGLRKSNATKTEPP